MAKLSMVSYPFRVVLPTLEKELWQSKGYVHLFDCVVLPTLEKELWQSHRSNTIIKSMVLPTLEKELWQSPKRKHCHLCQSCRHWKRNCGKARRP